MATNLPHWEVTAQHAARGDDWSLCLLVPVVWMLLANAVLQLWRVSYWHAAPNAVLHDILKARGQTRIHMHNSTWICLNSYSLFLSIQLEAFYSIFTTEQQDHVKSVEYLRNNFRPLQDLGSRKVFKSAVENAWQRDLTEILGSPHSTEASKGKLCFLYDF